MAHGTGSIASPPEEHDSAVRTVHLQAGHFGQPRTHRLVRQTYWCSGMTNIVNRVDQVCTSCDRLKAGVFKATFQLHPLHI